jgi:hypothetical protein
LNPWGVVAVLLCFVGVHQPGLAQSHPEPRTAAAADTPKAAPKKTKKPAKKSKKAKGAKPKKAGPNK